jgi:hypothetical protein
VNIVSVYTQKFNRSKLHADAVFNGMADTGLKPPDIDGIANAGETPVTVAYYLGLTRNWVAAPGRRLFVHDPCSPRCRGDRLGACATVLITDATGRPSRVVPARARLSDAHQRHPEGLY